MTVALLEAHVDQFVEALSRASIASQLAKHIKELEKDVGTLFIKQGNALSRKLSALSKFFRESDLTDSFDAIFDSATLSTSADMMDIVEERVKTIFLLGAVSQFSAFNVKANFKLDNPRAKAYLKDYGATFISGIDQTTRDDIKRILEASLEDGLTYNEVAQRIKVRYTQFAQGLPQKHIQSRAHLVAITEVGNAYQAGNYAGISQMQANGLQMEKSWLTSHDDRVSEGCKANEDQGWIPIDTAHVSGHMYPLRFPGCRCVELYRRDKSTTPTLKQKVSKAINITGKPSKDVEKVLNATYEEIADDYTGFDTFFKGYDVSVNQLAFEYDAETRKIRMNKGYAQGTLAAANKWQEAESKSIGAIQGGLDYTLVHELGHAVDAYIKQSVTDEAYTEYMQEKRELRKKLGNPSVYAEKNINEWTAERFLLEQRTKKEKSLQTLMKRYANTIKVQR